MRYAFLFATFFLTATPAANGSLILISDFEDGTLQGWTKSSYFGGQLLHRASGGNPGGWMVATDTVRGNFLFAVYDTRSFDLRGFDGMGWDDYIFNRGTSTRQATGAPRFGDDGTIFRTDVPLLGVSQWSSRFVEFDKSIWYQPSPSTQLSSFEQVLQSAKIGLTLDVSTMANGFPESGVDNVYLKRTMETVPEPGSIVIWVILVGGALGLWRKRRQLGDSDVSTTISQSLPNR